MSESGDVRRWPVPVLAALAAALLVATVVFAVLWLRDRGVEDGRDVALETARSYAHDVTTYDYRTLDEDFARTERGLTPDFRIEYRRQSARLRESIEQFRAVSTSRVVEAGLSSLTGSKATAVVFVDQTIKTTQTKEPRVDRNRMVLTLQKRDGDWKLSGLRLR